MLIYGNANNKNTNNSVTNNSHGRFRSPLFACRFSHAAFTLIEILITITIFSIFITAVLGLFSSAFQAQRRNLSTAYLLNSASYVTEYMSRALRMAKKDDLGGVNCLTEEKVNYEVTHSGQGIKFRSYNDECQEFYLDNGVLKVEKSSLSENLTPSNITINSLRFHISGESQDDKLQPKVTIVLEAEMEGLPPQYFQTTVSQRDLDVQY